MTDAPPPYPGISGYTGGAAGGGGAGGFVASAPPASGSNGAMSSADAKAAEAAGQVRTAYYDPNNPGMAFLPTQNNDLPPSYSESQSKKDN